MRQESGEGRFDVTWSVEMELFQNMRHIFLCSYNLHDLVIARFEVFTAVKIQVEIFWVHASVSYHNTTRHHNPEHLNMNVLNY